MASQMGKTAGLLNVIGHRLDDDPAPVLYIGPTKSNVDGVIEPQVQQMLRQCASLWRKTLQGRKAQKLIKRVAGVTLRLAWAGSATELASQPAHTVLLDEIDRMQPIPGEGDPMTLAEARNATYPDGKLIATSTTTEGSVDVEKHAVTGIEHWALADADDVDSPIWRMWQEGTRFEWAVPCPHCAEYFIPRFRLLSWPEGCAPKRAEREARLACAACGTLIGDEHKSGMNARGVYVAPGQSVVDGAVVGEPPESDTASYWVSGLMSPWVTFGQRAAAWLRAVASGDQERVRSTLNTAFGEMYRTRGQAPEWSSIRESCGLPYELGDVPTGVQVLFLTVDVQKDRLVCTVRGWGAAFESWLVHHEELWGETDQPEVWARLDQLKARTFGELPIRATAVDSGYRTDSVYEWCRRNGGAYPTKGRDNASKLFHASSVEVNRAGKRVKTGLKVWVIDDKHFKGWVHDRIGWPQDQPGAWHLPSGMDEDYCKQLVAEQRMRLPSGRVQWLKVGKDNHYLDCEALQAFLAHVEGVRNLRPMVGGEAPQPKKFKPRVSRSSYLGR